MTSLRNRCEGRIGGTGCGLYAAADTLQEGLDG